MLFKVAFRDETSQCELFEGGDSAGVEGQVVAENLHEMIWENHVADTDGRCQTFGECVDVDDIFAADAEKRWDRAACVAKFAVIFILDYDSL